MEHSRQTERRTQDVRKDSRQAEPERESGREAQNAGLTLGVLLAGGGLEHLPAGSVTACTRQVGNSAMLELLARRGSGPELAPGPLPQGEWADTPPLIWSRAELPLTQPPAFEGGEGGGGP